MMVNLEVYNNMVNWEDSLSSPLSISFTKWKMEVHPGVNFDISISKDGHLESIIKNHHIDPTKCVICTKEFILT